MIDCVVTGVLLEQDGAKTLIPLPERLKLLRELGHYLAPKIHAVEHTGPNGGPVQHAHAHFDVARLLQVPGAAQAAETLQLALLEQGNDEPLPAFCEATEPTSDNMQ